MNFNSSQLQQVEQLAKQVGEFLRKERDSFSMDKVEKKGRNDLVSYVDVTAEKMIVKGLKEILPHAGFITEEQTIKTEKKVQNWIIDPLDGTTNFIHGLPVFAVSIALEENDKLIAGVVYEVGRNECFSALKGHGAFMNSEPIGVSQEIKRGESLVATGFPYNNFDQEASYIAMFRKFINSTHGVRRFGSAAVDLCYVAIGRFDGFFEYNLNAWDVAAGALIVEEAGGTVTDFYGQADFISNRSILASNKKLHEQFMEFTSKFEK